MCPRGGGDKEASCEFWKKLKFCEPEKGYADFMRETCPASCGLCQGALFRIIIHASCHSTESSLNVSQEENICLPVLFYLLASKVIFIPCFLFSASHSSSKTSNYSRSVILILLTRRNNKTLQSSAFFL